MSLLDVYLEKIQKTESIFPMDSPHIDKSANNYILTGEETDDDDDEKRFS